MSKFNLQLDDALAVGMLGGSRAVPTSAKPEPTPPMLPIDECLDLLPLAMAYVPIQKWEEPYSPDMALERGVLFAALDMPFGGGKKQ